MERVAFEILKENVSWQTLLKEHRDHVLKQIVPVFSNDDGSRSINDVFKRLFHPQSAFGAGAKSTQGSGETGSSTSPTLGSGQTKSSTKKLKQLSECIDKVFVKEVVFQIGDAKFSVPYIKPASSDLPQPHNIFLWSVSKLYYGLRCILCHGNPTSTFEEGVLKDDPDTYGLNIDSHAKEITYYSTFRKAMYDKRRDVSVNLETVMNMIYFFETSAMILRKAIAVWVYDNCEKFVIWNK